MCFAVLTINLLIFSQQSLMPSTPRSPEPLSATTTPARTRGKNDKKTLRQAENASKRLAIDTSDNSAKQRLLRDRIRTSHALSDFRASIGKPMSPEEYPHDLRRIVETPRVMDGELEPEEDIDDFSHMY